MNTLKNSLSVMAFVLAIGAAFAFTSPTQSTKVAKLQGDCNGPDRQVAFDCLTTTTQNPQCEVIPVIGLPSGFGIDTQNCQTYHRP